MKAAADRPGGEEPVRERPRPVQSGAPAARPRSVDARTLQRLQSRAGNAAVSRLVAKPAAKPPSGGQAAAPAAAAGRSAPAEAPVQREPARGEAPVPREAALAEAPVRRETAPVEASVQRLEALPAPPGGLTPATDPRFQKVAGDLRAKKAVLTRHPTAASQAKAAQDAAKPPGDDKEAQAKGAQAAEMGAAKPGTFDKAAFVEAVSAAIAAKAPKTLGEADKFTQSGKTDEIKSQVSGQVKSGKEGSAKDITEKTKAAPDPSRAVEKPVTPLPGQAAPPAQAPPDAKAASVAPAPAAQTDLSTGPKETDAMMAEAKVTPEQLAHSNEPQFQDALAAKKEADDHAATAPAAFRAEEAGRIAAAQGGAAAAGPAGVQAMTAARAGAGQQVAAGQGAAQSKEEQERARISAEIKAVFDTTKQEVEGILGALDGEVETAFDQGQQRAKAAFDADHQTKMKAWKDERYSGVAGAARWLADEVFDPPPRANQIFAEARAVYEREMRAVISGIADLVGKRLGEATAKIAAGRQKIADKVAEQPKNLRQFAQQAATDIGGEFTALESSVSEKSQSLVQDLADKYVAARDEIDKEIAALQEANKGLLSKAKGALVGTLDTVLKLKDMLLGVLARAAGAIDKIIKDPIGFLGNLVNAVKAGVMGFAARIGEHLKSGLKQWLFGQLSAGGLEIPETFDAKGIVKLILSILGLTWSNIRTRIVAQIGEPAMKALETSFEMVQVLVTEGVGGLWKWLVGKLSDLKDTVVGAIKDFVTEKIVTAGITWIVSLLNPASAFVRACKAIYDVVMFFVNRAAQIKSFVDSVLDSIESIAGGGSGAVAGLIENSLAKAVPVVLDFLASLLGLGGISEKIKSILAKVQAPVMKAVDWVVGKIAGAGKKILSKLKSKVQGGDDSPEGKQARLDKGLAAAAAVANRYAGRPLSKLVVRGAFAAIRLKYGMTSLELEPAGRKWAVRGAVNPGGTLVTEALTEEQQAAEMMEAKDGSYAAKLQSVRELLTSAETDRSGRQASWTARKAQIEAVRQRRDGLPPGPEQQAARAEHQTLCEAQREDLAELAALAREITVRLGNVKKAETEQEQHRLGSFSALVERLRAATASTEGNKAVADKGVKEGRDFLGDIIKKQGGASDPMTAEHIFPMKWIVRLVCPPSRPGRKPIGFVQLNRENQLKLTNWPDNLVPLRRSVNSMRSDNSWKVTAPKVMADPNLKDVDGIAGRLAELITREATMEATLREQVGVLGEAQGLGR
ncbi:hypothetical protein [Streptomyces sp. NPDC089919]|uniref:hypothetical protein n=1 Tax=Streptomyces sp. NPDC089919 TaxID=3155188 RepID=UPI0034363B41